VELDRQEYPNVSTHFSFEDVGYEQTPNRAAVN
jgi:hypothetical protein